MKNILIFVLLALVGSLYSEVVNWYSIVGYKNEMRVVEIVLADERTNKKVIVSVNLANVPEDKENHIKSKVNCIRSFFWPRGHGPRENLIKDEKGYFISPLMDAQIWVRAGQENNIEAWCIHPPSININNVKKYLENNQVAVGDNESLKEGK